MNKYEIFLKVYETKNLSRAAELLNYTQSNISQIIKNMEKEWGFSLILRTPSGVKITQNGEGIIEHVKNIVDSERKIKQISSTITGAAEGTVRIGTFCSISMQWLPRIFRVFVKEHPKIKFEMIDCNYPDIPEFLFSDTIDCGFTTASHNANLNFTPLYNDEFVVVLPIGHPLTILKAIPTSELHKQGFIMPTEGMQFDIGEFFKAHGIKPTVQFATRDDLAGVAMVEQGLGLCVLPKLILEGIESNVAYRPLKERYYRTIGIAVHPKQYTSPSTLIFIDFVEQWVRKVYHNGGKMGLGLDLD